MDGLAIVIDDSFDLGWKMGGCPIWMTGSKIRSLDDEPKTSTVIATLLGSCCRCCSDWASASLSDWLAPGWIDLPL